MNDSRIDVWEATEHCSCNYCHATNYKSALSPKLFDEVDRLLCIQAGTMVITLCDKCALRLVQEIEPHICGDE